VVLADVVLLDVMRACQPSTIPANYQRRWFRNQAAGEGIQPLITTCADVNAPLYPPGMVVPVTPTLCPAYLADPALYGQSGAQVQAAMEGAAVRVTAVAVAVAVVLMAMN